MESWLGDSFLSFVVLTLGVFGWSAFATGNGVAASWQKAWRVVPYALLLAVAERFIDYALAGGELFSLGGFLLSAVLLTAIALFAWRLRRARMMVTQYPWLYSRAGWLGWKDKPAAAALGGARAEE